MEEKRKCIEIYITRRTDTDEETVEFKNIIEDIPENKEWFKVSSDIMKQVAYILMKIQEKDIEETEVNYKDDGDGKTSK